MACIPLRCYAPMLVGHPRTHIRKAQKTSGRLLSTVRNQGTPAVDDEEVWNIDQAGIRADWLRSDLNLVLVNPQIPQNAGTIARTCAATGVGLHLVKPLGFDVTNSRLKRAGLDYWPYVTVKIHDSWDDFVQFYKAGSSKKRLIGYSKSGTVHYAQPKLYEAGDYLLMGAETDGLPQAALDAVDILAYIPIIEKHVRSLNVAVAAGIGLYEAIRQIDGPQEA